MGTVKKTVLITGGAKGIGSAMAKKFASQGYNVLINYCSSEKKAYDLVEELKKKGYSAKAVQADVSEKQEVKALFDACLNTFGSIDVLINNAGIAQEKLFLDITESDWDQMMGVHLKGAFFCAQSALRIMLPEKKGKIINISSVWGLVGASCEVHYSVAKSGLIGLTKALAKELGPSGIQVNCIAPGVISTQMLSQYTDEDIKILKDQTPLGKIGTPEDIASLALYLASKGGDFITGQVISPNGGFVI